VTGLAVLIPVAAIGLIVWIIVGMRQRTAEPFTSASATAFYAHLMVIVTATAALCGAVLVVKAAFGFWNFSYSYSAGFISGPATSPCPSGVPADVCTNPPTPQFDFTPQRTQDLVLGLTLIVIGAAVAIAHQALARRLRALPGGRPVWVERGAAVAFTILYGFTAIFGLIAAVYTLISYFVVPSSSSGPTNFFPTASGGQPFGELVGTAIVFIPAWLVASIYLRRRLRTSAPLPPPAAAAATA
jgi:hypothetical protein